MTDQASRPPALPDRVAAVLFDMDDTLVQSEAAWFAAMDELWLEAGGDPTGKGVLGGTVQDLTRRFLQEYPSADPEAVDARLRQLLVRNLDGTVTPMPGAPELLARLSATLPVTIASNSPSEIVRQVVAELGWEDTFTAALGTEDVAEPKPAPDLYLAAARACGVDIADCVIFEDSPMGSAAARASGAFVVTVGPAAVGLGDLAVDSLLDDVVVGWRPEAIR